MGSGLSNLSHRGTESRTTCLYNVYIVTAALVLNGGGGGKGAAAGGDYIEFILIVVKRGYIQYPPRGLR